MFKNIALKLISDSMGKNIDLEAQERINRFLTERSVSGAACVVKNGTVIAEVYTGNFDKSTQFQIASVTKQFTAMAIMQLVEKESLKLDATLNTFIEDFPHGNKITVHHLLGMTSGLPRHNQNLDETKEISMEDLIVHIKDQIGTNDLMFDPGDKYEYSNINYQLLAFIITQVSGKDYATYMSENIFEPLGMNLTGLDYVKGGSPAIGFTGDGTEQADVVHPSVAIGSGCLKMSVPDMVKWQRELERLRLGLHGLISPDNFKIMITPGKGDYGYGFSGVNPEKYVYSHSGRIMGGSSYFMHSKDTGVIVFSNNDREVVDIIAKVVELKVSDNPIPRKFSCGLLFRNIQLLFYRNEVNEAVKMFSELDKLMEDTDPFAVYVQDEVGTLYFKYVKDNHERVNIEDLTKMLEVLENVSQKVPKFRQEYVQDAIKSLKKIKSEL